MKLFSLELVMSFALFNSLQVGFFLHGVLSLQVFHLLLGKGELRLYWQLNALGIRKQVIEVFIRSLGLLKLVLEHCLFFLHELDTDDLLFRLRLSMWHLFLEGHDLFEKLLLVLVEHFKFRLLLVPGSFDIRVLLADTFKLFDFGFKFLVLQHNLLISIVWKLLFVSVSLINGAHHLVKIILELSVLLSLLFDLGL